MTSRKGKTAVLVDRLPAAKKSIWGVTALTLAVCLSVGVAKGVFSLGTPDTNGTSATGQPTAVATGSSQAVPRGSERGLAAMSRAAAEDQYLFAFFWRSDDEQTAAMRQVFQDAAAKIADRAMTVSVQVTDPAESGIVERCGIVERFSLDDAPMPLAFAIAPNGAVTESLPNAFKEQDLLDAFATPSMERCMKALQDGKLVLLCVQNESTKSNQAALREVRDFKADARYANATETFVLDPRDPAEAPFLDNLQIDPQITTAVTVFLVPPSSVIAKYKGVTTKEQIAADLRKAKDKGGLADTR